MAETHRINVIYVENDPSVAFRLEKTLGDLADIHVIGSAATRREADVLLSQFKFQMGGFLFFKPCNRFLHQCPREKKRF